MKKLFKIVLVSSLALFCFSCYYNEFPEEEDIIIDPEEEISFANDILPIFADNNCTECHNGGSVNPDLRPDNAFSSLVPNYVTAFDSASSVLYNILDEGHRNLSNDELALIEGWIDRGAEDN